MGFPIFFRAGPKHSKVEAVVTLSCDELVRDWGDGAYTRATYLSWEEDFGLSRTPNPGHWSRVRREIDRRSGHVTIESTIKGAA